MTPIANRPAPATKSVFISYSRADLRAVRPLAQALRRTGLGTWLDLDDLRPGQRWKDAIGDALSAADAFVFCLSGLSLQSAWTSVELARARALALRIIPVAVEAIDFDALPEHLRALQVCDMSRHPPRQAAMLTAHEIALVLGCPVPPRPDGARSGLAALLLVNLGAPLWPGGRWPQALAGGGAVDCLDLSQPGRVPLDDLADAATQARRALLALGDAAEPAYAGLVLGTLVQAFGARRVALSWCGSGPPPPVVAGLARLAGVPVVALG